MSFEPPLTLPPSPPPATPQRVDNEDELGGVEKNGESQEAAAAEPTECFADSRHRPQQLRQNQCQRARTQRPRPRILEPHVVTIHKTETGKTRRPKRKDHESVDYDAVTVVTQGALIDHVFSIQTVRMRGPLVFEL